MKERVLQTVFQNVTGTKLQRKTHIQPPVVIISTQTCRYHVFSCERGITFIYYFKVLKKIKGVDMPLKKEMKSINQRYLFIVKLPTITIYSKTTNDTYL